MEKFIFCAVGISRSSYSDFDFVFQSTWSPTKKVKQINLNKISKPILTWCSISIPPENVKKQQPLKWSA